jgi:hypothetical protein
MKDIIWLMWLLILFYGGLLVILLWILGFTWTNFISGMIGYAIGFGIVYLYEKYIKKETPNE